MLGPNERNESKRKTIFELIKSVVENAYCKYFSSLILTEGSQNVMLLKYGSDPLKTYLPDSDIDITVVPVLSSFEEKKEGPYLGTMSALHQLKT